MEPKPQNSHQIVILGASFAGIRTAHRLLKRLPKLASSTGKSYKLTLIANSDHFWPVPTAPRAMTRPWPEKAEDTFLPIAPGFKQYPAELFEFVHAEITGFDTDAKAVTYKPKEAGPADTIKDEAITISYDTLVVALGARSVTPLYSLHGSHYPTLAAYKKMHEALPKAQSILVIGGGTAGVETAGELGHQFGSSKAITLLSGDKQLLPRIRKDLGPQAQKYLESLNVHVEHNVTMSSSTEDKDGRHTVVLSDGRTMTVDVLIQAVGRKPNTDIIPANIINETGRIAVDDQMRAKAVKPLGSVFAAGDISSSSIGDIVSIEFSMPVLENNIIATLKGDSDKAMKSFTGAPEVALIPVGPSKGVGVLFGFWLPSFFVWFLKSRHMMFPKAASIVNGKDV